MFVQMYKLYIYIYDVRYMYREDSNEKFIKNEFQPWVPPVWALVLQVLIQNFPLNILLRYFTIRFFVIILKLNYRPCSYSKNLIPLHALFVNDTIFTLNHKTCLLLLLFIVVLYYIREFIFVNFFLSTFKRI